MLSPNARKIPTISLLVYTKLSGLTSRVGPLKLDLGKMQSLAGGPPRGQNGEADRDRYSFKWTVPLHTASVLDPSERLEHSDIFRGHGDEMLKGRCRRG